MKRIIGAALALCLLAALALPVAAAGWKTLQSIDRSKFTYWYEQHRVQADKVLDAGELSPGGELRLYLNPTDFIATNGSRMDYLMTADLKEAKLALFYAHGDDSDFLADDIYKKIKLRYDDEQKTVYVSMRLKEDAPPTGSEEIFGRIYLVRNGRRLEETVLDLKFSISAAQ